MSCYYIVQNEGVIQVPPAHVQCNTRGITFSAKLAAEWWKHCRALGYVSAHAISAATGYYRWLSTRFVGVLSIDTGEARRRVWFTRCRVNNEAPMSLPFLPFPFGEPFMWILNADQCAYIQNSAADDRLSEHHLAHREVLLSMPPTHYDFDYREWPGCFLAQSISCWYDRMFIMSAPPPRNEVKLEDPGSFARPAHLQPCCGSRHLNSQTLPDELFDHLLYSCVVQFASDPALESARALLQMRLVSRAVRDQVAHWARFFVKTMGTKMRRAHQTERVDDLLEARDWARELGVTPIEFGPACAAPDDFRVWKRLRGLYTARAHSV